MNHATVASLLVLIAFLFPAPDAARAGDEGAMKTWDGRHPIDRVVVTMVYFVPSDREPLPDWKERIEYYAKRVEQFHQREYQGQSQARAIVRDRPFISRRTTAELREGDANRIYWRTLEEVADGIDFPREPGKTFRILLVLSDINWRPLEDFYRVRPTEDGGFTFEGQFINGLHHPGSGAGGARAAYLADRGAGWGLVSADGWRVPYRGSDCVVYHEGVGHTIGLPHPEPGDGSVMSLGQYRGWSNEAWLNPSQKERLRWSAPDDTAAGNASDLFTTFTALPEPAVPVPDTDVTLKLRWPEGVELASLEVSIQTALGQPWRAIEVPAQDPAPDRILLGRFEEETPVSYRIRAKSADGQSVELWGYLQVRRDPARPVLPEPDLVPPQDRQPFAQGKE